MPGGRGAETWLAELIWREFYQMIIFHRPTSSITPSSRVRRHWLGRCTGTFRRLARGRTGYPLVDAAMRQLNRTGYMHNRLRW